MAERGAAGPAILALQLSCRGHAMRERLLKDWLAFAESRGELPLLQGLPKTAKGGNVDWLRLYEEVVARGGYHAVCRDKRWGELVSREHLHIDLLPYQVAAAYERFLYAFEAKQLLGRDVPPPNPVAIAAALKRPIAESEQIATTGELQEAQSVRGTALPHASKRLKLQRQEHAELGTLHGLVLALDSDLEGEVIKAINLLSVLSYGHNAGATGSVPASVAAAPHGGGADAEQELLIDSVPGLLDALYRQLQTCHVLPKHPAHGPSESTTQRVRSRLLHSRSATTAAPTATSHKALMLLNILRNLSMVAENEKPLADHEDLVLFCILALREFDRQPEVADHALDILCNVAKRIDFLSLHPPTRVELWHPQYHLASHLWAREKVLPLECLLQQLTRMLVQPGTRRSLVLRVCELFCGVTRDPALRPLLSASRSLHDEAFVDRIIGLLASTRLDFGGRRRPGHGTGGGTDYEMDDDEDDDGDDEPEDESTKWPAPWESDGLPAGVGMGIVYVTPDGSRNAQSAAHSEDELRVDHEMRDASLEVLYRLSVCDDAYKLCLARHPFCLPRIAGVLTSCIGRPEAARIAVGILSNLSMNRETFPFFLAIEKDLILLACSDRSVSDILNNLIADVYGMHAL